MKTEGRSRPLETNPDTRATSEERTNEEDAQLNGECR